MLNVFISFDWGDREQVNGFRGMLANPEIFELSHRDTSVKHDYSEHGQRAFKNEILRKLGYSEVVVCLISQKTRHSDWVNWELEQARLAGLGILGIVLKEQPVATLSGAPAFFTRYREYQVFEWGTPAEMSNLIRGAVR